MSRQYSRQYIDETTEKMVEQYKKAAKYYHNYLEGKTFLILAKGKTWELNCDSKYFFHLCGVLSDLDKLEFYEAALNDTLSAENIFYSSRFPFKYAKTKADNMLFVFKGFTTSSNILTFLIADKREEPFPANINVEFKDKAGTLCFDTDSKGRYVPHSLRTKNKGFEHVKGDYPIDFVLSKRFKAFKKSQRVSKEYDTLEYGDLESLPKYLGERQIFKYPIDIDEIKRKESVFKELPDSSDKENININFKGVEKDD